MSVYGNGEEVRGEARSRASDGVRQDIDRVQYDRPACRATKGLGVKKVNERRLRGERLSSVAAQRAHLRHAIAEKTGS